MHKRIASIISPGKFIILFTVFTTLFTNAYCKQGMWVPANLKAHEADMRANGLQIPVDRIYNADGTGLNNAVVLFGKGCTGEIISSKGLILTNHHCGYGSVQGLSSLQKDYFANGFWAMSMNEELPCPGLTVTFVRRMENVTDKILYGINDTLPDAIRDVTINDRIKKLEKAYAYTTKMDAQIKPYYNGNQYWVILTETYRDIRLVGFPPNSIGNFGGDVENWMWPRHTGDFSIFRVYAGADNKPADYSPNNKPYQTSQFFTLNAGGYKEGDFTMVYGFPGYTQEYISSYQLNDVYSITDPIRIAIRTKRLGVWDKHMNQSRPVFIQYTSKKAGVANGWKKWQGEVRGLQMNNVIGLKQNYERDFTSWAVTDTSMPFADNLLPQMEALTIATDSIIKAEEYMREAVLGIELIQQASTLDKMIQCFRLHLGQAALQDTLTKLATDMHGFYKNYDLATDKEVFSTLMPLFFNDCSTWVPDFYRTAYAVHEHNYSNWANDVYNISLLTDENRLNKFATNATADDSMRILADPAWQLYNAINTERQEEILPKLYSYYIRMAYLNRLYMKAQMKKDQDKVFYPDANLTLRLTYGKVKGMDPEGPAGYSYQTTLNDVMALDNPDEDIFAVPQKLKDLYKAKDFGRWAQNGTVPVAFIATNHTSGGNSGSPVLNGKGQLIGTNFDRAWEGTMSDYYFDPNMCRNISVDIRYTLFIIQKFGGAGWLLKEMKIVK